jgi:hypothetical protein
LKTGIVRFNLTEPGGVLNGVTVFGAGDTPAAVVAITGRVKNVPVLSKMIKILLRCENLGLIN